MAVGPVHGSFPSAALWRRSAAGSRPCGRRCIRLPRGSLRATLLECRAPLDGRWLSNLRIGVCPEPQSHPRPTRHPREQWAGVTAICRFIYDRPLDTPHHWHGLQRHTFPLHRSLLHRYSRRHSLSILCAPSPSCCRHLPCISSSFSRLSAEFWCSLLVPWLLSVSGRSLARCRAPAGRLPLSTGQAPLLCTKRQ